MIVGHCFTCSRHTRVLIELGESLADAGMMVLRFDFSGNGTSEGRFEQSNYSKQIHELGSAMSYLQTNEGIDNLFLGGHSMGGMSALFAAAGDLRIKGVVALAVGMRMLTPEHLLNNNQQAELAKTGAVRFSSRGRDLLLTRALFDDAARFELPAEMDKIVCPVLQVHGGRDEIIPVSAARQLHAALPPGSEWFEVPGADHMFSHPEHRRKVTTRVKEWVQKFSAA